MTENNRERLSPSPTCRRRTDPLAMPPERLSREIKHRIRIAALLPNERSLLRDFRAVAIEIAEDLETGRICLSLDAEWLDRNSASTFDLPPTQGTRIATSCLPGQPRLITSVWKPKWIP